MPATFRLLDKKTVNNTYLTILLTVRLASKTISRLVAAWYSFRTGSFPDYVILSCDWSTGRKLIGECYRLFLKTVPLTSFSSNRKIRSGNVSVGFSHIHSCTCTRTKPLLLAYMFIGDEYVCEGEK